MSTATGRVFAGKRTTSLNQSSYILEIHAARKISNQLADMECRGADLTANASLWVMTENAHRVLIASLINIATWENALTSRKLENLASTAMNAVDRPPAFLITPDLSQVFAQST
jgi:hypothetical protein